MKLSVIQKTLWGFVGLALLAFVWLISSSNNRSEQSRNDEPAFYAAFELTDHRGMVQTEKDFAGRWMLVFFGFTNCPDICSTTLSEVAAVMDRLGDDAHKVQPIFVTVDPERDTPLALAEYVPSFGASLVGLTGTPDQIAVTSETFPIFYERVEEATAPDGYTMGHTSHLMLFDTQAGFAESWPYGTSAEDILADLKERL